MIYKTKARLVVILTVLLIVLFSGLAIFQPPTLKYPSLKVEIPGGLMLNFLMEGKGSIDECENVLNRLLSGILTTCPNCRNVENSCLTELDGEHKRALSELPLDTYSSRMKNGVVLYTAPDMGLAQLACMQSERQVASTPHVKCYPPKSERPEMATRIPHLLFVLGGLVLVTTAFLASWFACWLIVRFEHLHAHLTHDHIDSGPQKFHNTPTPRIGGLALMAGLLAAGTYLLAVSMPFNIDANGYAFLLVAGSVAFIGGITEDITKKVGVLERLFLTMLSGAIGAWLLGAHVDRLGVPLIDMALAWLPLSVLISVFAVGGIANAVNIIDGFNGLASGFALLALAAIACVAWQVDDSLILFTSLALFGTILGFFVWNWPAGKIFLGDGGAYLVGFLLAELSILIVVRNENVSTWFSLLVLIYPVFETLFSIYRRKIVDGLSPGQPDASHLHQLIYRYLEFIEVQSATPEYIAGRNSRVAPYIWVMTFLCMLPAVLWWNKAVVLALTLLTFCGIYVLTYRRLAQR